MASSKPPKSNISFASTAAASRSPKFVHALSRLQPYNPKVPSTPSAAEQPSTGTVPTRVLLVSDTHVHSPQIPDAYLSGFKHPLPQADVLIHAGDLSNHGDHRQLQVARKWIGLADAELKLVIAGNHDRGLDADSYLEWRRRRTGMSNSGRSKATPAMERGFVKEMEEIREMWTDEEAEAQGIRYLEEGVHEFELKNGAKFTVYASPYSPEFFDWAFMYPRNMDRYNPSPSSTPATPSPPSPNPIPSFPAIDILITHGPSANILDRAGRAANPANVRHVGCEHLLNAARRARPRLHVFGHIHEDWGMVRMDWQTGEGRYLRPVDCEGDDADGEWRGVVRRGWLGWDETGGELGVVRKGRVAVSQRGDSGEEKREEQRGSSSGRWNVRAMMRTVSGGRLCAGDGTGGELGVARKGGVAVRQREKDSGEVKQQEQKKELGHEENENKEGGNEKAEHPEQDADAMMRDSPLRRGRDTLCVNAAIMTADFVPMNAPWVVDLLLPAKGG